MTSDRELKELWGMQRTNTPDIKEMTAAINKLKQKNFRRLLFINICLSLTSAVIIAIWYFYQPQMITTKIGIVLVILAMAAFVIVANRTFPLLNKTSPDADTRVYLKQLKEYKVRQMFLQKTMMNLYFLLLTAGMCLYLIEPTKGRKYAWLVYLITLGWVVFNYLFTRPKRIREHRREVDEVIDKLEALVGQAENRA